MSTIEPQRVLQPGRLGTFNLRNRVVLAPMTRARAGVSRLPNRLMAEYYAQRATAGLLITEATAISEQALGWVNTPGIYRDDQREAWRLVTQAAHATETPIVLQLWHCGRASHSSFRADHSLPVAPSAIRHGGDYIHTPTGKQPYETPHALTAEEIAEVVSAYGAAAEAAEKAGFDGVEIHAANGYLLDQFLQSRTNHRDDRFGGSTENRYRFLGKVLDAVSAHWPSGRIGVRLSPNGDYNDMGSPDFRETFSFVIRRLDESGLGYLHVMDGLAFGSHQYGEPMTLPELRGMFSGGLLANCGYTQASAETTLAAGTADAVAFGRPFLSNPDLVERFEHGWRLAPEADRGTWYADTGAAGYTDFPRYGG